MKILFLVSSLEGGGAERVATLLCNAWSQQGHHINLCATFSGRGGCSYEIDASVNTIYLADLVSEQAGKIARLRSLRRLIKQSRPDVIVSFLSHVNVAAIIAASGTGVPVVACERIYPPMLAPALSKPYQVARRLCYRRARTLVAQTGDTEAWMRERFPATPIAVVPNPINLPLRATEPLLDPASVVGQSRNIILSVGRLDPQKRHDRAIDAFAAIAESHPNWDLVILGDGAERTALSDQIARQDLGNRIHMPGFAGNLGDWYRRAQMLVMPSAYEGFPNVLVEAMAHDLPTISFDIKSGPRDITADGRRGILLPDADHVTTLSQAMERLIRDPEELHSLGEKAGEVREAYSLEIVLQMWTDLLHQAMTRTGS